MRVVAASPAELRCHVPAWRELAASSLEPNVFFEPAVLLPAIEQLSGGREIVTLLVFDGAGSLIGLLPLEARSRLKRVPARNFTTFRHPHSFLCTPLLDRRHAAAALRAMLDWAAVRPRRATLVELPMVSGDGPFWSALQECVRPFKHPTWEVERFERPVLEVPGDAEVYLRAVSSGRQRQHRRRYERRLGELGELRYDRLEPDGDVDRWIEEFVALEASGWKGRAGSALACTRSELEFFRSVARNLFAEGRLMMLAMRIDDRPVAMKCNFLSRPGSFAFKVCFDERLSKHSPGVLLEVENIRALAGPAAPEWMDSCATPVGHPLFLRLWSASREIVDVVVPTGARGGPLLVRTLARAVPLRRRLRDVSDRFRSRARGRRSVSEGQQQP